MRALLLPLLLPLLGAIGTAQQQISGSASSQSYFVAALEFGSGEEADTLLYKVRPTQGAGVVAEPDAQSATYILRGGFPAALDAPVLGKPWLTGVRPFYVPQVGGTALTLHGTEMFLGSTPTITIGGQNATVGVRTVDRIFATLPTQPVPGFQPVQVTNSLGSTILNEGVGVLPMFETREPLNGVDPNSLRFHGTSGDLMLLALGISPAPFPYLLPGYNYSLQLDPNTVLLTNFYLILDADGKLSIPLPPVPPGVFRVQALVLTNNPGYAPGSWTNAVAL